MYRARIEQSAVRHPCATGSHLGKRVFTFPTAGQFLRQFGVVPISLPWAKVKTAVQTGELDGIAWSGITEIFTFGWVDVTGYFLTNSISGAWTGSFFANSDRCTNCRCICKSCLKLTMDSSRYYRLWWYWAVKPTSGAKDQRRSWLRFRALNVDSRRGCTLLLGRNRRGKRNQGQDL